MALPGFGPPSLPVGTEVSAKYRGAFCEAKVKTVIRVVKCKVVMKDCQSSIFVTDEEIKGPVKLGAVVEVKHPDTGQPIEATINKLIDHSTYTVVFDDGDERTLRRTQLCLKGDKHFIESETLDNLPLSHPEHFGTPVLQNKKAKRKNGDDSDDDDEDEDDMSEEESPRRAMYRGRHQELVGKLMLVDLPHRKGSVIPAIVVLPDANSLSEVKNRDQILVRSFKDSKFLTVTRKDLKDFSRAVAIKNDDKTMRTAFEKALLYHDTKELPVGWDREEMLGSDIEDEDGCDDDDEYASEDEPFEEKDRFVAQLYKFMDDRGTPINKGPCVGNKDLNLYKLFKIVQNLGGYNKVTKEMKWPVVYSKMGLPSLHQNPAHQIKTAYKKYLDAYETFYRKLGSTMGTLSRPGRARQNSGRSILNFRAREKSPRSPKPPEKVKSNTRIGLGKSVSSKEDAESAKQKVEVPAEKPEDNQDTVSVASTDDGDVVTRRTPRRESRLQVSREDSKEKKEDPAKSKKVEKKEEVAKNKKEEKKDETPAPKAKKEETPAPKAKKEETTPVTKAKKDEPAKGKKDEESLKKEERKSTRKGKVEEEKETEKEERVPSRGAKKEKEEEKKEEVKQEAVVQGKDSPKKRITRRKLLPTETKKEAEVKEEQQQEEKKEPKEPPKKAVAKETKVVEKKEKEIPRTLERRDSRASDKKESIPKPAEKKEVKSAEKKAKVPEEKKPKREKKPKEQEDQPGSDDNEEDDDSESEKSDSSIRHDYPIGSKLRVKYGRGKNQKIYIAKVVDFGRDGVHKTFLVHYAGWNTRYDEWIRPDRVVSVIDKPEWDKAKLHPAKPPAITSSGKKIPAIPPTTAVTKKTVAALKKPTQIFRTPKKIAAKPRATRSSSSDTSVTTKKTEKRMTRRRSNMTDSTGSKSPESHINSDADDATGSERADDDDDDNTKEDKEEEDDILDVEEDDDKAENDSVTEKSADMDTSAEEDAGPKEESSSEVESEKVEEEEEEEEGESQKDIKRQDGKEMGDSDLLKAKMNSPEDVKQELEPKKETSDLVKAEVKESVGKSASESPRGVGTSEVKQERATVCVAEVRGAVDEIRSAVFEDEDEALEENDDTEVKGSESTSALPPDWPIDNYYSESPKLEIIEDREPNEKDNGSERIESKSPSFEDSGAPVLIADQGIPHLKKIDIEQDKKDKEAEKPKGGRGRKKDTAKDAKKSVKTLDMAGTNAVPEIPTLEPMVVPSGPSGNKVEPSPYDFDAEVDTPWHPEITKKWEPTQKTQVVTKEGKDSTPSEEGDEKEKKKVKKKAKKKPISPEFVVAEEGSMSAVDEVVSVNTSDETLTSPGSGDAAADKQATKKKGRKKKEMNSETKKEVIEQYESTVNSVVEAVKHSLKETESDHEQRPAVKRRRVKRMSESDKKDTTVRVGKMGRKVASRDSLDVLDSVSQEEEKVKEEKTPISQSSPQNEPSSSHLPSSEVAGASTSSAQAEEGPATRGDTNRDTSFSESQGFVPQLEQHDASAPFDNTPPTTPEHEEDNSNAAMQHQQNIYHPSDLSSKSDAHKDSAKVICSSSATSSISLPASSNLAPSKSASESPSDNDVTSTTSTDNLDTTLTAQQSESSGTDQDVPSKKRKAADEAVNGMAVPKKKKRVHGTRSRTAKKSPKYTGNSDSQGSASNTPNHCPESPPTKFTDLSKSPRPSKYNFNADLGEYLEGEARCNFLITKMREIKSIYMNLKSEVASIDRRRKRARRKERESSQVSTNDKDGST